MPLNRHSSAECKICRVINQTGNDLLLPAISFDTGYIEFRDISFGQRIFAEYYGFAQITLIFDDEQQNHFVLETEYIQVMVRKGRQNDSVRRMTEYICRQNSELLNSRQLLPRNASGLKNAVQKTMEVRILLLEQISSVCEENFRHFKMNSRFCTIAEERVDQFEKLQYVSRNTLQYIACHPEELQRIPHPSGIKMGNHQRLLCSQQNWLISQYLYLVSQGRQFYFIQRRYCKPDFLIKYEYAGSPSVKCLIADAKFRQLETVKSGAKFKQD